MPHITLGLSELVANSCSGSLCINKTNELCNTAKAFCFNSQKSQLFSTSHRPFLDNLNLTTMSACGEIGGKMHQGVAKVKK